jgi:CpeS-like protein
MAIQAFAPVSLAPVPRTLPRAPCQAPRRSAVLTFQRHRHAARMTVSPSTSSPATSPALDTAGQPSTVKSAMDEFVYFFSAQSGSWDSERTYHYTDAKPGREDSSTSFDVDRLTDTDVRAVLESNGDQAMFDEGAANAAQGFRVSFVTKMASQEELVRSSTDLAFVPVDVDGGIVSGFYFRSLGYEEATPIKARFNFDAAKHTLNMITKYTKVVSVDAITLVNEKMRLRNIVNYARPPEGKPLRDPVLVGFGVEKKRK